MSGNNTRDMLRLVKWIRRQEGWTVELTGKCHWKVRNPAGQVVMCMPGTPGEGRSWKNTIADLRRAGLADVPRAF